MKIEDNWLSMRMPDDFHLHLRNGEMLQGVLPYTELQFQRALVMPNTASPVLNAQDVSNYRNEIYRAKDVGDFEPLMSIQIIPTTTPEKIFEARDAGAVAGKIYPKGVTTNSENGISDYSKLTEVFEAMQDCGMLALFHGESPDPRVSCLQREICFLNTISMVAREFPGLKIVMEHITTAAAERLIRLSGSNLAATVTVHHLFLTIDDLIGDKLEPHNFCKPIAKLPDDRSALLEAVFSGNPKFFLGTDSAPHLREAKECASGCAGVYTAPVAIPLLADLFERHGKLDRLENFCSSFGADFYGLPRNDGILKLTRRPWRVAEIYDGVVPFWASRDINWRL